MLLLARIGGANVESFTPRNRATGKEGQAEVSCAFCRSA
jgi:hypothetical protein